MPKKIIKVPILARVEGEGALELQLQNGQIKKLQLRIYEPPRLFEKFLEGRSYDEVLDFVARICGICPIAYQMSAAQAIENIFALDVGPWVRDMRRLFYCGEWMESHSMHIHFLAVPDFFGYASATEMAKDYPKEVRRGLRLQGLGNAIIKLLGGRSVHPVGACVGGFFRAPHATEINNLLSRLHEGLADAEALIRWVSAISFPHNTQDFICVSLRDRDEYPMIQGRIISDNGLDISIDQFDAHFKEKQVPYSHALQCTLNGKSYLVGPLARVNLNYDRLPPSVHKILKACGIHFPSKNMFHSIIARATEIYYALTESIRILENYQYPKISKLEVKPRAGIDYGCTEAPRGLLWHRYELNEKGIVLTSRIVPPTSQNQARIEEDLYLSLHQYGLHHDADKLRSYSEMIIRNYDPCISCSTHFLKFSVKHS